MSAFSFVIPWNIIPQYKGECVLRKYNWLVGFSSMVYDKKVCITILYHAIENKWPTQSKQHTGIYALRMIKRLGVLHRKCTVRVFIHSLQNFEKRMSEQTSEFTKVLQRVNKNLYKALCCNLFIIYRKKNKTTCIGSQLSVSFWLSKQSYTKRWLAIFFTYEVSYTRHWLDVSLSSHVKYRYRILFATFIA